MGSLKQIAPQFVKVIPDYKFRLNSFSWLIIGSMSALPFLIVERRVEFDWVGLGVWPGKWAELAFSYSAWSQENSFRASGSSKVTSTRDRSWGNKNTINF